MTTFLYDGVNLIGEYNSSSQMLRRYVHGPGIDNPIVWYEGSGNVTLRYFYTNQQGSVVTTADGSGNRGDIYAYGAYGEPKDQYGFTYWPAIGTGSTSVSRFGYTGQTFLADARLYYYKARVYDPQMGRFLQTDPIGSDDDMNLYAYTRGDPINLTDPTGECPMCGGFVIGAVTGAAIEAGLQYVQYGKITDKGAIAREALIGGVAGASGAGAGQLLLKGAKVVKLGRAAMVATEVVAGGVEGAVSGGVSAHMKGEPSDGNITEGAVVGTVSRGAGKLVKAVLPKPKFARVAAPKPVLEVVKKTTDGGTPAALGANTENAINAVDAASQSCRTDQRCKK